MTTHVGFLRAINTGRRRITNDDLVAAARSTGLADVRAYQASGNLIFSADEPADLVAERLTHGLGEELGFEVPVVVRSAVQIAALVAADPFPGERPPPNSKPQAIFLVRPVTDAAIVGSFADGADRLAIVGADLVWWPQDGISTSELDLAGLEQALGTMTVRTIGTVERIARLLSADSPPSVASV